MLLVMVMGVIGYSGDEVGGGGKEIGMGKVKGGEGWCMVELVWKEVVVVGLGGVVVGRVGWWYMKGMWMEEFGEEVGVGWVVYVVVVMGNVGVMVGWVVWKWWGIGKEKGVKSMKSE